MQTLTNPEHINQAESACRKIRQVLEVCHGMRLAELSVRTRLPEVLVQSQLELMIRRGEVDCLRPIDYDLDDLNFYALRRSVRGWQGHPWDD